MKRLRKQQYAELARCETLEDVKSYLQATNVYCSSLQHIQNPVKPANIIFGCRKSLVSEFKSCCEQAAMPLSKFLEYLTYGHMIDSLILALSGMLRGRQTEEILEKCNPLGIFESLSAVVISQDIHELYRLVLVDTPLAKYLNGKVTAQDLNELNVELVRNIMYKEYLQDFLKFCSSLDEKTSSLMQKLLCLEADRHAIRITVNSFGTELSKCDRQSLFTDFGNLHPEGQSRLMQCESFDEVRNILSTYPDLQKLTSATSFHEIDKVTDLTNLQVCSSRLHRECGDLS